MKIVLPEVQERGSVEGKLGSGGWPRPLCSKSFCVCVFFCFHVFLLSVCVFLCWHVFVFLCVENKIVSDWDQCHAAAQLFIVVYLCVHVCVFAYCVFACLCVCVLRVSWGQAVGQGRVASHLWAGSDSLYSPTHPPTPSKIRGYDKSHHLGTECIRTDLDMTVKYIYCNCE